MQPYTLGEEALTALYDQFLAVESPAAPLWSFLDAVLFRELVNAPETLETVHSIFHGHEVASLRDVFVWRRSCKPIMRPIFLLSC